MKHIRIPMQNIQKYSYNNSFFSIGSCFSENIAKHLASLGIKTFSNPFGVVYNPYSIYQQLLHITDKDKYVTEDLSFCNDKYFLFCHSACNDSEFADSVLDSANNQLSRAKISFEQSDVFLITLGSAVIYEAYKSICQTASNEEKIITANCHRVPQNKMSRRLMTHNECCKYINNIIKIIREQKPGSDIIITVSPAKHYPGEPLLDSASKARLKSALTEITENYNNEHISYFPSLEIFRDELGDKKWYKDDGTHPNKKAVSFIMKRFVSSSFTKQTQVTMNEILSIKKRLHHRPSEPGSNANFELLKKITVQLKAIKSANTSSLRFEVACRLVESFYNHEQVDKLIDDLFSGNNLFFDSNEKSLILSLLFFFRKESSFQSLPVQLFTDKRLVSVLISFLTKNGV